jgi:protein SCO1/2
MRTKFNYYWLLVIVPIVFISWFLLRQKEDKPLRYLAYYGPKNAIKAKDTAYHTIPDFEFTDQYNEKINSDSVKGKIYVTEYFFTTCKSICPIMNSNLDRIYKDFKKRKGFLILSHTVDPETDSVPVLKAYADIHGVKDKKWLFVTGSKQKLYELARKGYLLNTEDGDGGEEDFIHTQNFALIDKERHIRGYYDGTDSLEINRLVQDLNLLFKEYEYKERASH